MYSLIFSYFWYHVALWGQFTETGVIFPKRFLYSCTHMCVHAQSHLSLSSSLSSVQLHLALTDIQSLQECVQCRWCKRLEGNRDTAREPHGLNQSFMSVYNSYKLIEETKVNISAQESTRSIHYKYYSGHLKVP